MDSKKSVVVVVDFKVAASLIFFCIVARQTLQIRTSKVVEATRTLLKRISTFFPAPLRPSPHLKCYVNAVTLSLLAPPKSTELPLSLIITYLSYIPMYHSLFLPEQPTKRSRLPILIKSVDVSLSPAAHLIEPASLGT